MATLADLQLEREKLRALAAKAAFDEARAATVAHADVLAATAGLRRVLDAALAALPRELLAAIEREGDETRTHWLLSDAIHATLTELGQRAEAACVALPALGERFRRGATPRDPLSVSQWADRHRWLRTGTNAPGRWNTALTPYLREIMDALGEHSPVRTVSFLKSSGVGGTEAAANWLGYVMHHLGNKDLLVVVPTLELRDRSFNPRLAKMIDESEALSALVNSASRNKANRADILEYGARARIIRAGANSPDSLRSDHLPYVLCDEVDAFPWDVGGEGDPMTLIENRQRTFSRAKTLYVSTPTQAGRSRITQLFERSDQRRYHVPCPHCGSLQHLEFDRTGTAAHGLKWRIAPQVDSATGEVLPPRVASAWYVCKSCHEAIPESHKTAMLSAGRWVAAQPGNTRHRGYHINALYAPVGLGLRWADIAQKWLECQGDSSELKAFVNTYLGLAWADEGDSIEDLNLLARAEPYTPAQVMPQISIITAGCDVQKDRIEASIVGWGAGEEGWLLDHLILPGDTEEPAVYADLAEALAAAGVHLACVDAGFRPTAVLAFAEATPWCIPTRGMPGIGAARPLVEDERRRQQRLRARAKRGVPVEPLGVDQGKGLIYSRLKMTAPGPGYLHFPADVAFDDEYFAQLAAEKLVTKMRGTRPFSEWVKVRARNEALDCLVYALAALRLAGQRTAATPAATPAPRTAPRRVATSAYVRR